ncbi:hypothetical protein D3C80_2114040 [compost metagenome]
MGMLIHGMSVLRTIWNWRQCSAWGWLLGIVVVIIVHVLNFRVVTTWMTISRVRSISFCSIMFLLLFRIIVV